MPAFFVFSLMILQGFYNFYRTILLWLVSLGVFFMKLQNIIIIFIIIVAIVFVTFFVFNQTEEIKVGVLVNLSGSHSDVGIDIRDGVRLAVDEVNRSELLEGFQIELMIRDHEMDIKKANAAIEEFNESGVEVIIGPTLSGMVMSVINKVNELDMIMLSPTSGSKALISTDNNLFRMVPSSEEEQRIVVNDILNKYPDARVAFIYDRSNFAFTSDWRQQLSHRLLKGGGRLVESNAYDFTRLDNHKVPIHNLSNDFDALVIAANPIDTAMLVQNYYNTFGDDIKQVYATRWSFDRSLMDYGGKSVEGIIIPHPWKYDHGSYRESEFNLSFNKYYNRMPNFGAYYGYEAVLVLKELLADGVRYHSEDIKNELESGRSFNGLEEIMRFNRFGDAIRTIHLYRIENGDFRRIDDR